MIWQEWALSAVVSVAVLLIGGAYAEHQRRISRLETHMEEHDRWAGLKAEELSATTATANDLPTRLDRIDGRMDRFEQKLDRFLERVMGRITNGA